MSFSLEFNREIKDEGINKIKRDSITVNDPMKISFLILGHKNPSQIVTFVNALDCESFKFFIHINKKSDIGNNGVLEEIKNRKNVYFLDEREEVRWGGYSLVKATLLLLRKALEINQGGYISLHSGQDLPIKSKAQILDFLSNNRGKEFVEFWKIPKPGWEVDGGLRRINYYWLIDEFGYDGASKILEEQKRLNHKRKFFHNMEPYGGSMWWTITRECGEYIIDYVNQNKTFCDYYKYTLLPDEGFFQTIILNSHFKDKVINNNLRHIEWEAWQSHPNIFREYDYNKLISSDRLFARKFDIDVDNKIIEMIAHKIAD
ncbi:beta-1,6-N-acetylglucosaminyltransferase [Maledivibacter halophilus]|uniref:Peptide O-xylosyltransferase n=1 Tax=Maledivibacter halophilus TaxID=36842 RepID=A0A1T5L3F2_9FIRM|nr:beta-1,6-N-acetylglucosaminyltransferase [Maledivibacter halophilus]SKC69928.1 Core-2/I-Branching enzyme [Maledivibacter halophilus]